MIDHQCLLELLGIPSMDILQRSHRSWVEEAVSLERNVRDSKWPESIAVGSENFVAMVKRQPGLRAKGRKISKSTHVCQLRETQFPYRAISGAKMAF